MSVKTVIIGHRDPDGIFSASVAKMATLENDASAPIQMYDVQYGEKPLGDEIIEGNNVYIVDFSYSRETLVRWKEISNSITVIDHHESAEKALNGLDFCTFDMTKAGVRLTWEYFYGYTELPDALAYVEDRDLFKLELPNCRAYMTVLQKFVSMDEELYAEAVKMIESNEYFHSLVTDAQLAVAQYEEQQIERLASYYHWKYIDGQRVPVVNCRMWGSDVCAILYKKFPEIPFVATYFETPDRDNIDIVNRVYSLRSAEHGANIAEICMKYGGGGHAHAGGFTVPV